MAFTKTSENVILTVQKVFRLSGTYEVPMATEDTS